MSSNPSISVVIPVHNGERFLAAALRSVLTQSLPVREIVVVDDGSTDRSAEIAAEFAPLVRLLRQTQAGAGAARNTGIGVAQGEMIALLDADDLMTPDRLEIQWRAMCAGAGELIFGQQYKFFDGEEPFAALQCGVFPATRMTPALCGGALFCRRGIFDTLGLFEPQWPAGEVVSWLAQARDRGIRLSVPAQVVLCRRMHGANITLGKNKVDFTKVVKAIRDRRRADALRG